MINEKYQFNSFLTYPTVAHGISTKAFGSMKDIAALSRFVLSVGGSDEIVTMQQIHSGNVSVVIDNKQQKIAETDSLVSNKKDITLAVLTADCLPILLYDTKKEVMGIAHAGYRGLLNHIIEDTVSTFTNEFNSNPEYIIVGIGPSIETSCYEVGKEVVEMFEDTFPKFTNMYSEEKGKYYLDLRNVALQCLQSKSILKEHIEVMGICTKDDEHFYSYRGGDGDKRFASVIRLV